MSAAIFEKLAGGPIYAIFNGFSSAREPDIISLYIACSVSFESGPLLCAETLSYTIRSLSGE